jgi:hypothetical protein
MHQDSGWRPEPCQDCHGYEVYTHTAPWEINGGEKEPDEMDLDSRE